MENLTICLETEKDYRAVEELTREAFWNVYKPGCDEHYYTHTMRSHEDFIPEIAFVVEKDGEIIGSQKRGRRAWKNFIFTDIPAWFAERKQWICPDCASAVGTDAYIYCRQMPRIVFPDIVRQEKLQYFT